MRLVRLIQPTKRIMWLNPAHIRSVVEEIGTEEQCIIVFGISEPVEKVRVSGSLSQVTQAINEAMKA